MKKLLFVIPNLMGGGAERVLVNLVNALDRSQFEITLLSLFDCGVYRQNLSDHVKYAYIYKKQVRGNSKLLAFFSPEWLHDRFVKAHYDVEIAFLEGVAARIVSGCRDKTVKKICWVHTTLQDDAVFVKGFRSRTEALQCYDRFDRVVCVSESVRQAFEQQTGVRRTDVLYNPIDGEQIASMASAPARYPYADGLPSVCAVGKLDPVKGFDRLAGICASLRAAGAPAHFYLCGSGSEQARLHSLAETYGIADLFTLTGFLENPYAVMAKCDLFVCASRREGFSSVTAEAMFCRAPIVTVDVPGMRELLGEDNACGVICENADDALLAAIEALLADPARRSRLAANAAARVRRFDKTHAVAAAETFFNEL